MNQKLVALRKLMQQKGLSAYIIPTSDPHMSEYLAPHWHTRKWLTGFTGSAGTAVVTQSEAGLWTDGRYYIQAERELQGSGFKLFKLFSPGVPDHATWLSQNLPSGAKIGIDGHIISTASFQTLSKKLAAKNVKVSIQYDLVGRLWKDRPELPLETVFEHAVKFAGCSRKEKVTDLRRQMQKKGIDNYIISALDEIAWLFNIRGNDIAYNPVTIAYAVISTKTANLFIDGKKLPAKLIKILEKSNIKIYDYNEIATYLNNLGKGVKVGYSPGSSNHWLVSQIPADTDEIETGSLIATAKSKKNEIEIENLKRCLQRDCVALVKFFYWLEKNLGKLEITETSAAAKLAGFRSQQENFKSLSFTSISAYGANAAMMHYAPQAGKDAVLEKQGFYLIDSGGQYLDGTTDITRTLALGKLSPEEKRDFTLVLQAHIDLTLAKFLKGSTGANLDILARKPMWDNGLDYKCGTGHGVGFFLNVHEGPQNFSQKLVNVPLEPGMVTTNEPGIYREGVRGIRTENMLLTVPDKTTDCGEFLKFETLSFCPIDRYAILPEMLSAEEKDWLNEYHAQVYKKLSPALEQEERDWLKEKTRSI